jgi:hypothetical protein
MKLVRMSPFIIFSIASAVVVGAAPWDAKKVR